MSAHLGAVSALIAILAGCGGADPGASGADSDPSGAASPAEAGLEVAVDPRVELLSILFRLAGAQPYGEARTPYARAADARFSRVAGHGTIAASRALIDEQGISYDAVVELAGYIDDSFEPIRPLDPLPPGLDPRWKGVDIDAYLNQVRAFATEADFAGFHASQSTYHAAVEAAFKEHLAGEPVVAWFDDAFGPLRGASYRVVPGLLSGGFGFGTTVERADGSLDVAAVAFLESPDEDGVPQPTTRSLEFLVHEFAHSYVNPVFDGRAEAMRASAEPVFREVEAAMREQSYTSYPIMVNESVVRALTVLFLREQVGDAEAQRSLDEQTDLSFSWTPELADALAGELERVGRLEPPAMVAAAQEVLTDWLRG